MKSCGKSHCKFIGILALIMLISVSWGMSYVGEDDLNYLVFSGNKGAYRVNPDMNSFFIDNALEMYTFPKISVSGKVMEAPDARYERPVPGAKLGEFSVKYENGYLEDVYANVETKFSDKDIRINLHLENSGDTDKIVTIEFSPETEEFSYYAPYVNHGDNFIALSPRYEGLFGRLEVIYFDPIPPSYRINQSYGEVSPKAILTWAIKIPSKQAYDISLDILPGYLANSKALVNLPVRSVVDKEPFLIVDSDPILEFYHPEDLEKFTPHLDLNKGGEEIFQDIEEYVDKLGSGNPEFGLVSYIDWRELSSKSEFNSLEKSIILREVCRKVGIPARLHIGRSRAGNYYAWVTAYIGGTKRVYDPFGKRDQYPEVFKEGEPYVCKDNIKLCSFKGAVKTGIVCIGPLCFNVIAISIVILVIVLGVFIFISYKSEMVKMLLAGKPEASLRIDGSYDVIEMKEFEDPLLSEVFEYVKSNNGLVDVADMQKRLGYSRILIISAIEKLVEEGVIRKR